MKDFLPVMEVYYTLQGEGYYTGTPAYFIRLGGCDIGCHWCDVKESWDAEVHEKQSVETIVQAIPQEVKYVVVTGGEPAMWKLESLSEQIRQRGMRLHIETSGAYELQGNFDWICVSPKRKKLPHATTIKQADELKIVVYNQQDFILAEAYAKLVKPNCKLFLQVEWSKREVLTEQIIAYALKNPKWRISIQVHKYIGIS